MHRYENRFTIMTSNRPLDEWGKLLCDVPTQSQTDSRIGEAGACVYHVYVVDAKMLMASCSAPPG